MQHCRVAQLLCWPCKDACGKEQPVVEWRERALMQCQEYEFRNVQCLVESACGASHVERVGRVQHGAEYFAVLQDLVQGVCRVVSLVFSLGNRPLPEPLT